MNKYEQFWLEVQPFCSHLVFGESLSGDFCLSKLAAWQSFQWILQVPVKGGRDYITHQKAIYKWYILPIGGLYATYHPLKEPDKSIDLLHVFSTTIKLLVFFHVFPDQGVLAP